MLQLLAYLTLLIPIPVWALMIFGSRRAITRQVVNSYMVFVLLGILFIFLAVGFVAQWTDLSNTVVAALRSSPPDASALSVVSAALPGLFWVILAGSSVMDLAGGTLIYNETQRMGTQPVTAGVLLALTWLLGPVGMLIFALWRYLAEVRQALPAAVTDHAAV